MINILALIKKIKINPLFWFIIGIGALSGYFKELIIVFTIVFIHELGHSVAAQYYKWRIKKIELLPFGGVAEVEEHGNRPLKEEFIVIIAGPLQHVWLIGLSFFLLQFDFWSNSDHQMFVTHNLMVLFFNLLPVWPLDGGKLLYLFFSKKLAFQKSLEVTLKASFTILCIFTLLSFYIFPFHLNLIVVLIFLFFTHYFDWKKRSFAYMRFLMERHYQKYEPFIETVPVYVSEKLTVQEVLKTFRRGVKHKIILKDDSYAKKRIIKEKVVLTAFFDENKAIAPIATLAPP